MMRLGALSLSGLILVMLSCGGGGGSSSTAGTTSGNTQIASQEEARAVTAGSLRLISSGLGLRQASKSILNSQSVKKRGWLMYIMSMYSYSNALKAQETRTECNGGGNATITTNESGNTVSIRVDFDNCVTEDGSKINGSVFMSGKDADGNGIPEEISMSIKGGFSVSNTDGNLYVQRDLTISITGNNGDIYDNFGDVNATMTMDGGPAEMKAEGKKFIVSYDNLSVYIKTQGEKYELAVNGGITYQDDYCVIEGVSLSIKTVENFEGYSDYCDYKGKMSINNDTIVLEAYDNDNDPLSNNYLKVTYNGQVIYDGLCEEFTPPETCQ
ncbi:hypothetical protein [Aquifex sp.]